MLILLKIRKQFSRRINHFSRVVERIIGADYLTLSLKNSLIQKSSLDSCSLSTKYGTEKWKGGRMFFLWKSSQTLVKYFPEVLLCQVRLACQFYCIVTHSLDPISSHSSSKFLVKYLQEGFTLFVYSLWNLKRKFIDNLKSIL